MFENGHIVAPVVAINGETDGLRSQGSLLTPTDRLTHIIIIHHPWRIFQQKSAVKIIYIIIGVGVHLYIIYMIIYVIYRFFPCPLESMEPPPVAI